MRHVSIHALLISLLLAVTFAVKPVSASPAGSISGISLSASSVDFSTVRIDSTRQITVYIRNGGTSTLHISGIAFSGAAFSIASPIDSIAAGDSTAADINFKPTSPLNYADTMSITSDDSANPRLEVELTGQGDEVISLLPGPYSSSAPDTTDIEVRLAVALDPSTLSDSTVRVNGSYSGTDSSSSIQFDAGTMTLKWIPSKPFRKGELVTVTLTSKIKSMSGQPAFVPHGWIFQIGSQASSAIFSPVKSVPVPDGPTDIVAADFDNDGYVDLAVVSHNVDTLTVLRNEGNWNFVTVAKMACGFGATSVLAGDYNNDGKTDLVVTNENGQLIFFKNNGGFNFTQITVSAPGYLDYIIQGDYNGDGLIDLVAGSSPDVQTYDVIQNDGNFKFTVYTRSFLNYPSGLVTGDFDGDGDPDVAMDCSGLIVLRNDGSFNFTPTFSSVNGAMSAWDFFGHGRPDIVTGGYPYYFTLLRNLGYMQFQEDDNVFPAVGYSPSAEAPIDLDGDGVMDFAELSSSGLILLKNDGTKFSISAILSPPATAWNFTTADFDNNGTNDIAVVSINSDVISFYSNLPAYAGIKMSTTLLNFGRVQQDSSRSLMFTVSDTGSLALKIDTMFTSNAYFTVSPTSATIKPGDSLHVNVVFTPGAVDTFSDSLTLVSGDSVSRTVYCRLLGATFQIIADTVSPRMNDINVTRDTFTVHFTEPVVSSSLTPSAIKVNGSMSGPHNVSLSFDNSSGTLSIMPTGSLIAGEVVTVTLTSSISLGGGIPLISPFSWSFTMRTRAGTAKFEKMKDIPVGVYPRYICTADFNHDGVPDIAVSNSSSSGISLIRCSKHFSPVLVETIPIATYPADIAAGDMDGDGNMDIVAFTGGGITILKGDGNWHFTSNYIPVATGLEGISLADLDGDGRLDIVAGCFDNQDIIILRNDGNLKFTQIVLPYSAPQPIQISTGDFDNDGNIDILVSKGAGDNFLFLHNEGKMNFVPVPIPNISGYVQTMALADFNGDGRLDIAAEAPYMNSTKLLLNNGDLTFSVDYNASFNTDPLSLTAADFDNDGALDIATVNNGYSNTGSIYLNDSLQFKPSGTFPIVPGSQNMVSGDFLGDGSMDIAFVNQGSNSISWLVNRDSVGYDFSAQSLDFGKVKAGQTGKDTVTVFNTGILPLAVDTAFTRSGSFALSINRTSLVAGDSLYIPISFSPDSAGGFTDTLTVVLGTDSAVSVFLHGQGTPLTGIKKFGDDVPSEFALYQNYPNPFNPSTTIRFAVPGRSRVSITLYDILGRVVARLVDGDFTPGYYTYDLNAEGYASGVYFYRITATLNSDREQTSFTSTKKLLLLK